MGKCRRPVRPLLGFDELDEGQRAVKARELSNAGDVGTKHRSTEAPTYLPNRASRTPSGGTFKPKEEVEILKSMFGGFWQ